MKTRNNHVDTKNAKEGQKSPQPQLREIRGIGEAVANRIISHFGSEDTALMVINSGDVSKLSAIEGIGPRLASRIVREYYALETGIRLEDFLKTEDSIKIYMGIQEVIRKFASTLYARNKLEVYFPLQGIRFDEIKKRQQLFQDSISVFSLLKVQEGSLRKELKKLIPLREPRTNPIISRCICSLNINIISSLKTSPFSKFIDLVTIESVEEVVEHSQNYDEVILISDEGL
ncbi:MAG: helix-hairpin-helix domain-containing protein, partial [Promethearchaeota archaeon]